MAKKDNISRVCFSVFILLRATNLFAEAVVSKTAVTKSSIYEPVINEIAVNPVSLRADVFEHISFPRLKASHYSFHDQQLQIVVAKSASFLMLPFDEIKQVSKVSFEWRSDGFPAVKDSSHEKQRSGDDAVFKIGLMLKTEHNLANPFFHSWIKKVDELLKFPSDRLVYLVANAKHSAGEQSDNPYNKRASMISVACDVEASGWQTCSYSFKPALEVVGLWLMADGDNTNSSFTSHVRNIRIE